MRPTPTRIPRQSNLTGWVSSGPTKIHNPTLLILMARSVVEGHQARLHVRLVTPSREHALLACFLCSPRFL
eukprot:COSAG05_NODE_768_length_7455_cov_4.609027_7_plen_71_part_00